MQQIFICTILSVLLVSIISLIGILTLPIKTKNLRNFLIYLISFSAGTLLGDAFIHLLPETVKNYGLTLTVSLSILAGIIIFFILEKFIHWQHCHGTITESRHIHSFAYMNLIGDAIHNFLDGIIIAASYLISIPAGFATTLAVLFHEIPQEIGDFGVLLHGGFSRGKALALNFISALTAVLGAILTLWLGSTITSIESVLVPIAIGGFVYIASSDLIPQLHKHSDKISKSLLQLLAFVAGIAVMTLLLVLE